MKDHTGGEVIALITDRRGVLAGGEKRAEKREQKREKKDTSPKRRDDPRTSREMAFGRVP